jgi:hypothetical protein
MMSKFNNGFVAVVTAALGGVIALGVQSQWHRHVEQTTQRFLRKEAIVQVTASSSSTPEVDADCSTTEKSHCQYSPWNMVDFDQNSAWFANEEATGESWVYFEFDQRYQVDELRIRPGWQVLDRPCLFKRNQRPRRITIEVDRGGQGEYDLPDGPFERTIKIGVATSTVRIRINSVFPGKACAGDIDGGGAAHTSPGISDVRFFVRAA